MRIRFINAAFTFLVAGSVAPHAAGHTTDGDCAAPALAKDQSLLQGQASLHVARVDAKLEAVTAKHKAEMNELEQEEVAGLSYAADQLEKALQISQAEQAAAKKEGAVKVSPGFSKAAETSQVLPDDEAAVAFEPSTVQVVSESATTLPGTEV